MTETLWACSFLTWNFSISYTSYGYSSDDLAPYHIVDHIPGIQIAREAIQRRHII